MIGRTRSALRLLTTSLTLFADFAGREGRDNAEIGITFSKDCSRMMNECYRCRLFLRASKLPLPFGAMISQTSFRLQLYFAGQLKRRLMEVEIWLVYFVSPLV